MLAISSCSSCTDPSFKIQDPLRADWSFRKYTAFEANHALTRKQSLNLLDMRHLLVSLTLLLCTVYVASLVCALCCIVSPAVL